MSEVPLSSPYRSTPEEPVTEDERNQVSARLNAAYTEGSLDADSYQLRLDQLFAAQRLGELLPVVEGLPPVATYASPAIVHSTGGRPGELAPARSGTNLTLIAVASVVGVLVLLTIIVAIAL